VQRSRLRLALATNLTLAILVLGWPTAAHAAPVNRISIADASVVEGTGGATHLKFTISYSGPHRSMTVDWATQPGTATAGTDYTTSSGTASLTASTRSVVVKVPVLSDAIQESDETVLVNLSNPAPAGRTSISDGQAVGTIVDDDGPGALSIDDVSVAEGDAGTTTAHFTVTLAPASGRTVTVDYATADQTATAPSDYQATSGTLTFPAGATTRKIPVNVRGDLTHEPDEAYEVDLSSPTHAALSDATGVGTITNDDPIPAITIDDASVAEGDAGTSTLSLPVTLDRRSFEDVSVDVVTSDGTAVAGADYQSLATTVTVPAGSTSTTADVTMDGDTAFEGDETIAVDLSNPVGGTIAGGSAVGTIANDDAAPTLSIDDVSAAEGDAGTTTFTFTVTKTGDTALPASVGYATADGSASSADDYVAHSGTLAIPANQASGTIDVTVNGDTTSEANETFTVELSAPSDATIADGSGTGTILDDEPTPSLTIDDVTVAEGDAGTTTASFTVSLSHATASTVTVDAATANGTAAAGSDYEAWSGPLSFPPGTTSVPVDVTIDGDTVAEADETFSVGLSNEANAIVVRSPGTGTITDDDPVHTALTLHVRATRTRLLPGGLLTHATAGMHVRVTVFRLRPSSAVRIGSHRVLVTRIRDRNGDGVREGAFRARFPRPVPGGHFRVRVTFAGDAQHLASSRSLLLRLG